jgi:Fibronectin type III domain
MRYRNLPVLILTAALAACSTGASHSGGSNGTASGIIQTSAALTRSTASAKASVATARASNSITSAAATSNARIGTSVGTQSGTASSSRTSFNKAAVVQSSITGTPAPNVLVGSAYTFAPVVTGVSDAAPTFAIVNCPSWATFNPATGLLSGTPSVADVGTYSKISVSVIADGGTVESLSPFSITVTELAAGFATLTWDAPTQKSDGTPFTDPAGFRIYYGTDPNSLDQSVDVVGGTLNSYTVRNLLPGTWYFEIHAYSGSSIYGSASATVSKQVM